MLNAPKNWQRLMPGTPSLNGPTSRSRSAGLSVSMCTTVAPWSANALAVMGPTPIHEKSATLTPSSGRRLLRLATAAVGAGAADRTSASTSSVCSPGSGAPPVQATGAFDDLMNGPGARTV